MAASVEFAAHVRPKVGWPVAGDAALARVENGRLLGAIVDVLGHGVDAHVLAQRIEAFVSSRVSTDPMSSMSELREHVKGSVGAAVGLIELDLGSGDLGYVGIGNTVFRKFGEGETRLVSTPGIVGGVARAPRLFRTRISAGEIILLYTDGIRDHFELKEYPQLLTHDAATVARIMVERFGKSHDDSACLAVRYQP